MSYANHRCGYCGGSNRLEHSRIHSRYFVYQCGRCRNRNNVDRDALQFLVNQAVNAAPFVAIATGHPIVGAAIAGLTYPILSLFDDDDDFF